MNPINIALYVLDDCSDSKHSFVCLHELLLEGVLHPAAGVPRVHVVHLVVVGHRPGDHPVMHLALMLLLVNRVLRLRQKYASFDSLYFPLNGLGHLGKGWIVRGITTRRLPYMAKGLFYPSWNRLYRFTAYQ